MTTLAQAIVIANNAGKLAERMAKNDELTGHIENAIKVAKENKVTVNLIHFDLFGTPNGDYKDGIFGDEDYASLPVVGSEEGKTGNLPFDYHEYKDASGTAQKVYFWRTVAERHPVGADIQKKLDAIRDREKIANEYTDMDEADVDTLKADLKGDFTTFYGKLKLAVQCFHMMKDVGEKLEDIVEVTYASSPRLDPKTKKAVKDKAGEIIYDLDSDKPQVIEVKDASNPKNPARKFFTMANFVRLNVELTLAGEGNYAAFITSNKRGTDDDENPDETKHVKIETPRDFEDGTIAFLHYINGAKKNTPVWRNLVAFYMAAGSDDRLKTLYAAQDALAILTGLPELKKRADAFEMGASQREAA